MGNVIFDIMPDSRFDPFIGDSADLNVSVHFARPFRLIASWTWTGIHELHTGYRAAPRTDKFAYPGHRRQWPSAPPDRLNIHDLTYRYLSGSKDHFASTTSYPQPFGSFVGTYADNSVTIGVRYAFASPPAAPRRLLLPPPPPAASPAATPARRPRLPRGDLRPARFHVIYFPRGIST